MSTDTEKQVQKIKASDELSAEEKIEKLLKLRTDSRAAQRAATEGGMDAPDSLQTDLQNIDRALAMLGFEDEADEKNAATL